MAEPQTQDHLLRVTPLTYVLVVVLALVSALYLWAPWRDAAAADQAAIEAIVHDADAILAETEQLLERTRYLMDPLSLLLSTDEALEAHGLPPLSGKEFADRLAKEDRRLVTSGGTKYIDTCRQRTEVEKHLLYEGLRGPFTPLPGWSKDWQTRCRPFLAPR